MALSLQKTGIYFPHQNSMQPHFPYGNMSYYPLPWFANRFVEARNEWADTTKSNLAWPSLALLPPPPMPFLHPTGPPPQREVRGTEIPQRGRPRANVVNLLKKEGELNVWSSNRCDDCGRVFTRHRSLQVHKRTHSGEKPFVCDFPSCGKAFVQKGQLKTHQRLHTGEKPFVCPVKDCGTRFTHAHRQCPVHPYAKLKRVPTEIPLKKVLLCEVDDLSEYKRAVLGWLVNYEREKEGKSWISDEEKDLKRKLKEEVECGESNGRKRPKKEEDDMFGDTTPHWMGSAEVSRLTL